MALDRFGRHSRGGRRLVVGQRWGDNSFTFVNHDQALHGADYCRIYVTKQGFDPTTDELTWGDLELLADIGVVEPGEGEPSKDPDLIFLQRRDVLRLGQ